MRARGANIIELSHKYLLSPSSAPAAPPRSSPALAGLCWAERSGLRTFLGLILLGSCHREWSWGCSGSPFPCLPAAAAVSGEVGAGGPRHGDCETQLIWGERLAARNHSCPRARAPSLPGGNWHGRNLQHTDN